MHEGGDAGHRDERGPHVGQQGAAGPATGEAAQLADPAVVDVLVPSPQPRLGGEEPHLLRGTWRQEHAGQVGPLAVLGGEPEVELVVRPAVAGGGEVQRHVGQQHGGEHDRLDPREHDGQRHHRDERAQEGDDRDRDLPAPLAGVDERPPEAVVERRVLEVGQRHQRDHVHDAALDVAFDEGGQHPLPLVEHRGDARREGRDDADGHQRGHEIADVLRAAIADHRVEHDLAEEQLQHDAHGGGHLQQPAEDQLTGRRGPREAHRAEGETHELTGPGPLARVGTGLVEGG